jgi:hypothetical protein
MLRLFIVLDVGDGIARAQQVVRLNTRFLLPTVSLAFPIATHVESPYEREHIRL